MVTARDGDEALRRLRSSWPDLLIIDMMMPRWGGFAVLEHYQGDTTAPPFIMITANESDKHRAYAETIGVTAHLRKPFSLDQLLEHVDGVLKPAKPLNLPAHAQVRLTIEVLPASPLTVGKLKAFPRSLVALGQLHKG